MYISLNFTKQETKGHGEGGEGGGEDSLTVNFSEGP